MVCCLLLLKTIYTDSTNLLMNQMCVMHNANSLQPVQDVIVLRRHEAWEQCLPNQAVVTKSDRVAEGCHRPA